MCPCLRILSAPLHLWLQYLPRPCAIRPAETEKILLQFKQQHSIWLIFDMAYFNRKQGKRTSVLFAFLGLGGVLMALLYTHLAAALVGAAVAATSAWQVQSWRFDAKEKQRLESEAEIRRMNEKRTSLAAEGLEKDKREIEIRYRTITKTVTKFIDRPVYKNICLDQDGIDAINGVAK